MKRTQIFAFEMLKKKERKKEMTGSLNVLSYALTVVDEIKHQNSPLKARLLSELCWFGVGGEECDILC